MTIYTWYASTRLPAEINRRLVANNAILSSTFNGAAQRVIRNQWWEIECTWRNVHSEAANEILAWFRRLNTGDHYAQIHTSDANNKGAYGGAPVVDGASQTGNAINIRGADLSVTDWGKVGDYIAFENGTWRELHQLTADADSDGTGDVALSILPRIRVSPADGASVYVGSSTSLHGTYIMTSPVESLVTPRRATTAGDYLIDVSLSFVERLV